MTGRSRDEQCSVKGLPVGPPTVLEYAGGSASDQPSALEEARAGAYVEDGIDPYAEDEALYAGSRPATAVETRRVDETVGRNDPCPCGSGKKYKKCHGA